MKYGQKYKVKYSLQVPKGQVGVVDDYQHIPGTGLTAIKLVFDNHESFWFLNTQVKILSE